MLKRTVIYKISHKENHTNKIYIGSTSDFKYRIWKHKYCCNTPTYYKYTSPLYKFINENGGWDKFEFIVLYEFHEDISKKELLEKEGEFIHIYKDICINKISKPYNPKKKNIIHKIEICIIE